MWVSGSTSSRSRSKTSSMTSWPTIASRASVTAAPHGEHLLGLGARAGSRGPGRRPRRSGGTPSPACGVRCSSTASRPAARASTLLPVPAGPPMATMPTSWSASRSMAMRCSAERPCTSNSVRSPRTRWTALVLVHAAERRLAAGVQRRRRCCTAGRGPRRGRRRGRRTAASMVGPSTSSSTKPVQLRVAGQLVAVLVGVEADDRRLEPQRQVLGDDRDRRGPRRRGCGPRRGCGGRCCRRSAPPGSPTSRCG